MREIHEYKKKQAIKLFLSGVSYDDIAKKLGIAKGTVVNIIDDFREGRLKLPLDCAEYVDSLRKVAVDLRKNDININQLMYLLEIGEKIRSIGVEVGEIDNWLDVCKEMASPVSDKGFTDASLQLAQLRKETGMSYSELLADYRSKQELLEAVTVDIKKSNEELETLRIEKSQAEVELAEVKRDLDQLRRNSEKHKARLKRNLGKFLEENKLTWKRIRKIEAIVDSAFAANGLTQTKAEYLYNRIIRAGSLVKLVDKLSEQAEYMLAHHEHAYKELGQVLHKREQAELSVKKIRREMAKLKNEIDSEKTEVNRLAKIIHDNRERIYAADIMLTFLFAPNGSNRVQLDKLVNMFISLRKIKLGIQPNIVTDTSGNIICKCEVPKELGGDDLRDLDSNKVREALAYAIAPIVNDKYVPRILHDIALMGRPLIENLTEVECISEKLIQGPSN